MSRNHIPALVAIGVGIFTGYYTFQPSLKELQVDKTTPQREQQQPQDAQSTMTSVKGGSETGVKSDAGSQK
ncbi:hypothetical protein BDV25DRAFT_142451 [Aspergillus avenaceus]|uniref:Uncharacterized protein n=1 Tax=Aspergillus avenaceus TaxID=36643 RepID=A0A5N6TNS3_ASPAV|nr:hypothetical protein BDV25DRAFT_142451 [Aspergillus avenaceus]